MRPSSQSRHTTGESVPDLVGGSADPLELQVGRQEPRMHCHDHVIDGKNYRCAVNGHEPMNLFDARQIVSADS